MGWGYTLTGGGEMHGHKEGRWLGGGGAIG